MRKHTKIIAFMTLAIFAMGVFSAPAEARKMLQIKGSDTLINLVQRLSEVYMDEGGSPIAVTGGGSGTGIAALMNNKCSIANASRLMRPKEVTKALAAGISPKRVVVAMDGLSVIVNASNGIDRLTVPQIGKLFRGEVTNWAELGGANVPVTLYGRQSNSGTFVFFRDAVVKADYAGAMRRMNGNSQIVEAVRADKGGIGYVGVGYVKKAEGITVLKVAAFEGAPFASPLSAEDVKTGRYAIARPLNQYVNGTPEGATKRFIEFELSPEGQKIVAEEGFFPIPKEYEDFNKKSVGI